MSPVRSRVAGGTDGLHFVFTRARRVERLADASGVRCGSPMACQWAVAESTQINRIILRNGVGAYRTSDQASEWLKEYNRRFPTPLLVLATSQTLSIRASSPRRPLNRALTSWN
jgi:hypothetical protein